MSQPKRKHAASDQAGDGAVDEASGSTGHQAGDDAEPEPAAPLNRAERRAQQRGKQLPQSSAGGRGPQAGYRDQVVVPRRSGRRGNR
jgi:hypothetical protein